MLYCSRPVFTAVFASVSAKVNKETSGVIETGEYLLLHMQSLQDIRTVCVCVCVRVCVCVCLHHLSPAVLITESEQTQHTEQKLPLYPLPQGSYVTVIHGVKTTQQVHDCSEPHAHTHNLMHTLPQWPGKRFKIHRGTNWFSTLSCSIM